MLDRHPSLDTLTGHDPDEDDDRLMRAIDAFEAALAMRGEAIQRLREKSDPPPALPAAPAPA